MRILIVLGVIGRLLRLFSVAFIPPILLGILDGQYATSLHFTVALLASFIAGSLFAYASPVARHFYRAEALGVVAFTWLILALFGAIPYVRIGLSPVDAFFESMSGLTTTGATILQDFGKYDRAFFLWRAMTQWFGGLGVIALFVVVLPQLGIAGRQLFFAEASEVGQGISPQIKETARKLWILYAGLTALLAILLFLSGFTVYDAIVHSLTTLSAGGFSPNGESIMGYQNKTAEWILVVFMVLAGTSFTLQWKAFTSRPLALFRDEEFRFYIGAAALGATALVVVRSLDQGWTWDHVRDGAFQSASLISSTGFASADYDQWGDAARAILVGTMLVSGCAGSAAGGAKAIRHLLAAKFLHREITQVLHPCGVLPLRYGHRVVPQAIMRAVFTLVFLYLTGFVVVGLAVVVLGEDLITGFSAALACLGNIGPGFSNVGPMLNFAGLPSASKVILTLAMWVGRLEIVSVLALLHPHVWRNMQLIGRRGGS